MSENTPPDSEALFAASVAQRLVTKSRAHVSTTIRQLNERQLKAAPSTPRGQDRAAHDAGLHKLAHNARLHHVEAASNALDMHLRGLEAIMRQDVFYPLPAVAVVRAIAETTADCAWLLRAASSDERTARAWAVMFRDLEQGARVTPARADHLAQQREQLVTQLESQRGRVQRVRKRDVEQPNIDTVWVGRSRAKLGYAYSHRVADQIPAIGGMYSAMSAVVHGEVFTVTTALEDPAVFARMIAVVALRSVEAWSSAVHGWVGAAPPPVYSAHDYETLINTIPEAVRAQLLSEE